MYDILKLGWEILYLNIEISNLGSLQELLYAENINKYKENYKSSRIYNLFCTDNLGHPKSLKIDSVLKT